MKDFNLQVRVRNAHILRAMRAAGLNNSELARLAGVSPSVVGKLINLRHGIINKTTGDYRLGVIEICAVLNKTPQELWPESIKDFIAAGPAETELSQDEVAAYIAEEKSSEQLAIEHDLLEKMIAVLPPRQRQVIALRYVDNATLREAGDELGVGPERIRQIEAKALRKMRECARELSAPTVKNLERSA